MITEKYAGLFHDGALWEIHYFHGDAILWMESSELLPEWNEDNIPLSKRNTLSGKLHLEGTKNVKEENESVSRKLQIKEGYDRARIFDFEFQSNKIMLVLQWIKYLPEYTESDMSQYEIKAEKIYWENIPTLFDIYWDSLLG